MKVTTDKLTGKPFRYNGTVFYMGKMVPACTTLRGQTWLHPDRVPSALLAKLNPVDNGAAKD